MGRKLLWASLVLAPITFLLRYVFDAGDTTLFVVAAAALVPLAWLIGEATEHAGEHTGPGIGGFLNASFGNAPELIIAVFAVSQGLPNVVRGSLAGSVVSNLLLVLGLAVALGPGRDRLIDRRSLMGQLGTRLPRDRALPRALGTRLERERRAAFARDRDLAGRGGAAVRVRGGDDPRAPPAPPVARRERRRAGGRLDA